jgi:hypothetical protein
VSTNFAIATPSENLHDIREVLPTLLDALPDVLSCTFARLRVPPVMQNRLPDESRLRPLVRAALQLRNRYDFPFWDGLLLNSERDGVVPAEILDGATFHQPIGAALGTTVVQASELTRQIVDELGRDRLKGEIVVVLSKVELSNGRGAHVPMLDFALPRSSSNDKTVRAMLSRLGIPGVVLSSGNSYHFYGLRLFSNATMRKFLGSALLLSPLIDHRWVAHQLIEGQCALRVSPNGDPESWPQFVSLVA